MDLVKNDFERTTDTVKYYDEKIQSSDDGYRRLSCPISITIKRIRILIDMSITRLRNIVLFSAGGTNVSVAQSIIASKISLKLLTNAYHEQIRSMLQPYIKDKESFRNIEGQEDKTTLLRFLIRENRNFARSSVPILKCLEVHMSSQVYVFCLNIYIHIHISTHACTYVYI